MSDVPSNLIPTRISQLPLKTATTSDSVIGVQNGVTCKLSVSDLIGSVTVPSYRTLTAGTCLTGGGDLSADRTFSVASNSIGAAQLTLTGVAAGTYGSTTTAPVITVDTSGRITSASSTSVGSVTSVGLSMPTEFTVTNSPVISSGNLTANWSSQTANTVLAAPSTGSGTPSFRLLVAADIPSLSATYVLKAGDTMTGGLTLPASTSTLAPLNLQQGVAKTTPSTGDVWHQAEGLMFKAASGTQQIDTDSNTAGALSAPTITITGSGATFSASSIEAFLFSNSDWTGSFRKYVIPAATGLELQDGVATYLTVNYNSGNPIFAVTTNVGTINASNVVGASLLWRDGTKVHYPNINWGLATASRLNRRLVQTNRYQRASGLLLGESTGNVITLTAGTLWYGVAEYAEALATSASSNCDLYYHSSGSWTSTVVSTYSNTQYDDGVNIQSLGIGKYGVNWVYRYVDGSGLPKLAIVLGNASYPTATAAAAVTAVPTPPNILTTMAIFVGRIIVGYGASTASQIDSAFTTTFTGSVVTDHNSLAGLQGGASSQYYHLTSTEYTGTGTGAFVRADSATLTGSISFTGTYSTTAPVTKTADFTLGSAENWVVCNKSGSNCTVTLPSASAWTGREVTIKNIATSYSVVSASSNIIPFNGGSAQTIICRPNLSFVALVSNGTNWVVMQTNDAWSV